MKGYPCLGGFPGRHADSHHSAGIFRTSLTLGPSAFKDFQIFAHAKEAALEVCAQRKSLGFHTNPLSASCRGSERAARPHCANVERPGQVVPPGRV